ncbi:MAG: hypothetical protein LUD00_04245 [Prevotellaceae bacterium]|nr:hypothetical protein [Prevotellaceae bacterium]
MHYIPIEYKGVKGWAAMSQIYPVKLSEGDTLVFDHATALKDRTAIERYLTPQMEWVMNLPATHMTWIYAMIISVLIAVGFYAFTLVDRFRPVRNVFFGLTAVALVALSAAEILYIFSFYSHVLWFAKPSLVGGWGHVILNFLVMSVILAVQAVLFLLCWGEPLKTDKYNNWIYKLPAVPVALGVLFMVMSWIDYASDTPFTAKTYLILFGSIGVAALIGMFHHFRNKRFIEGIVFPVCFVCIGIGMAVSVMILSMIVVLVVVVGAIAIFGLLLVLSPIAGLLFGKKRVKGTTEDGTEVKGWEDRYGNIQGDDGKTYTRK